MDHPKFDPQVLADVIQICKGTSWHPEDALKSMIMGEVARYCAAAELELNVDNPIHLNLIVGLCGIFTQGLEVGYQYPRVS